MEIIAALEAVRSHDGAVHIVSDSTYVVNCFNDRWWQGWIARGWKNSKKEPVANRDLWEPFVELVRSREETSGAVTFEWVKGHSGDPNNDLVDRLAVKASQSGVGDSGDGPPDATQLAEPDRPGSRRAAIPAAPAADSSASPIDRRARDKRIPEGWTVAVVGVRSDSLVGSPAGDRALLRLTEVLAAQSQLHSDLVVLTGLRPGAEELAATAAVAAGVPYVVVLPYPDPAAQWPPMERAAFDGACSAALEVVTLERSRPPDGEGKRAAMARRDGWLRGAASSAVVLISGADPEAERLVRRFEEVLGDEVWFLELV